MKIAAAVKKKLRQRAFTWRCILNLKPTIAYQFYRPSLRGEASRIMRELNRDGISVTTQEALLEESGLYYELCTEAERLGKKFEPEIQAARGLAGNANTIGQKKFIYFLLGDTPPISSESVFARFALQDSILGIANSYLAMYSQLRYYNVWHTLANASPARESQLWHRDRDDYLTCKVFLYLNDVDEGAGPFTYAKGTHPKGTNHGEPEFTLEGTVKRSSDEQMERVAPKSTWVKAMGRRGTIVFADTRGFHKGGEARTRDRIMYTCMFISPASEVREMMDVSSRVKLPLERATAFALSRYA